MLCAITRAALAAECAADTLILRSKYAESLGVRRHRSSRHRAWSLDRGGGGGEKHRTVGRKGSPGQTGGPSATQISSPCAGPGWIAGHALGAGHQGTNACAHLERGTRVVSSKLHALLLCRAAPCRADLKVGLDHLGWHACRRTVLGCAALPSHLISPAGMHESSIEPVNPNRLQCQ